MKASYVINSMIICSVCRTENDKYATICIKCGGFLQNRVANLDLFDVIWKIIENPRKAFQTIMLAEHKNYALFLYTLWGISATFAGFWYFRVGDRFENILFLIFWALIIGVPLGIGLFPTVSILHWILSKSFGGISSFRTSIGISSYALIPIILSLVVILPIELMTFGMYLFTGNPHPMALKPMLYIVLIGIDSAMVFWTFILLIIGTAVGNQIPFWKSFLIASLLCGMVFSVFMFGGKYIVGIL
jgi:hypothetical protein